MSRHSIPARSLGYSVVVGWDNPLMTFFAQVEEENPADEDEAWSFGSGARIGNIPARGHDRAASGICRLDAGHDPDLAGAPGSHARQGARAAAAGPLPVGTKLAVRSGLKSRF
jgi:hypothetical protein